MAFLGRREGLLVYDVGECRAYRCGLIIQAPPASNQMPALPVWHAHPAVTVRESVGPSGLPGAQLRLASIWPDSGNTWLFKNKSNNGWTERGGPSNGDFISHLNSTD